MSAMREKIVHSCRLLGALAPLDGGGEGRGGAMRTPTPDLSRGGGV